MGNYNRYNLKEEIEHGLCGKITGNKKDQAYRMDWRVLRSQSLFRITKTAAEYRGGLFIYFFIGRTQ